MSGLTSEHGPAGGETVSSPELLSQTAPTGTSSLIQERRNPNPKPVKLVNLPAVARDYLP